ncbi:hypothetical protein AAFN86_23100 [Roseomonas sp. CAU 1739]|uniref:hypothetical protein n=1 Tax=Roseomonas sp. CAU 1739 TaxID=3140364 RepID=UPI00325B3CE7
MVRYLLLLPVLLPVLLLGSHPAASRTWPEEKCDRYGRAWTEAMRRQGAQDLSAAFLEGHAAFLSSGCRQRNACPRTREDYAMADLMTVLALNAGMSGTFLPFICRP